MARDMSKIMGVLEKNAKKDKRKGIGFETVVSETENYRYIDFCDPMNNTPCFALEYLWGCRGMLTGRMLKIEAEEGTGKSCYTMLSYAMGQKSHDAICVHEESEGTVPPPDFVAQFGADPNQIIVPKLNVRSIESAFEDVDWTTRQIREDVDPEKESPIVVGIDSISGFGAEDNMDEEDFEAGSGGGIGMHARVVSRWFRDRGYVLEDRDVLLIVTAQLREKMGGTGGFNAGPRTTTLAARPLNFHASYRLKMFGQKMLDGTTQIGEYVNFETTKNKLSPKGKKIIVPLHWTEGFDLQSASCDVLKKLSPMTLPDGTVFKVEQRGAWIGCPNVAEKNFQSNQEGKTAMMTMIYENDALYAGIREACRIRGFGFEFETRYMPSQSEIEDQEGGDED